MVMEDYEKQEELGRANRLASESNELHRRLLEQQERQGFELRQQHEEKLRNMQRLEEEKQVAQFEKDMDDRIYKLKVDIAKTKDEDTKAELQVLLNEEEAKRDSYYYEKEAREAAARLANEKRQEEIRKEARKDKILSLIKKIILVALLAILGFIAFAWYFSSSNNDRNTSSFAGATKSTKAQSSTSQGASETNSSKSSSTISKAQSSTSQTSTKTSSSQFSSMTASSTNFQVKVSVKDLNIRESPSSKAKIVAVCPVGVYTIVEIKSVDGLNWGKLKTGKGWIALKYTQKVSEGGTTDSVSSQEWEMTYNYYYVASNTSTLMMAGFKLEDNGKVTLYRAGGKLMAYNAGTPVVGTYTIENYNTSDQVTSFIINQRSVVNGDSPETKLVSPDIILKIHVPASELQKVDSNMTKDEESIFYGYHSNLNQHILTDGNSSYPTVFFHIGE